MCWAINFIAGNQITRHILYLGAREIAVLKGPSKYSSMADRLRGCMAAMAEEQLLFPTRVDARTIVRSSDQGLCAVQEISGARTSPNGGDCHQR